MASGATSPHAGPWPGGTANSAKPRRFSRWAQWLLVSAAGLIGWILFMLGAVLQREYLVLLFPAGWCVYVAMRQFRLLARGA